MTMIFQGAVLSYGTKITTDTAGDQIWVEQTSDDHPGTEVVVLDESAQQTLFLHLAKKFAYREA